MKNNSPSWVKIPRLTVLRKNYFQCFVWMKIWLEEVFNFACWEVFWVFLNRKKVFSRKLKNYWKCREKNKSFQTILLIFFWSFTRFCCSFDWPQLEQNLISSIGKFLYVASHAAKRADVYNILKNENIIRILNSIEDKNFCTVSSFGNSSENVSLTRFESALILSKFTQYCHFVRSMFPWLAE